MSLLSDIDPNEIDRDLSMGQKVVKMKILQPMGKSQKMEYGKEMDYDPTPVITITSDAMLNTIELMNAGIL